MGESEGWQEGWSQYKKGKTNLKSFMQIEMWMPWIAQSTPYLFQLPIITVEF